MSAPREGDDGIVRPKEGRWIAKPLRPRFGVVHVAFVGIYAQISIQLARLITGDHPSHWLFFAVIGALLMVPLGVLVRQTLARRERDEDRALVDGGFGDQFTAEVTLVCGSRRIGADRGVVWFADGLMGFSGRATSFVLAAWDVSPIWQGVKSSPRAGLPVGSICLVNAPVDGAVVVTPLADQGKAYLERLRRFEKETAAPDAERFWPPLAGYDALTTVALQAGSRKS